MVFAVDYGGSEKRIYFLKRLIINRKHYKQCSVYIREYLFSSNWLKTGKSQMEFEGYDFSGEIKKIIQKDKVSFLGVSMALMQKGKHSSFLFGFRFPVHQLGSLCHPNHLLPYGTVKDQNETLQRKPKRYHLQQSSL